MKARKNKFRQTLRRARTIRITEKGHEILRQIDAGTYHFKQRRPQNADAH